MDGESLGVSVVALTGPFEIALDCFKHVKVAKSFGSDYQSYVLRLQDLRLRLSRWGEAVGLGKQPTATDQPRTSTLSEPNVKEAEELVSRVARLFSGAETVAERYTGKQHDLVVVDEDVDGLGDVGKLCQKMRDICLRRQRGSDTVTKAKWSFFPKDKFTELIGDLKSLINNLVGLFPEEARVSLEESLCGQEAKELRNEKALPTLQTLALEQDAHLAEAIAKLTQVVRLPDQVNSGRHLQYCRVLRNQPRSTTSAARS
jgi:hypothetical protein